MQLGDPSGTPVEDDWLRGWLTTALQHKSRDGEDYGPLKLGLAVSGGGDSMAMLHLFAGQAARNGVALEAATVNHGLRPEAADEAQFVASVCENLRISHQTLSWSGWDGTGNLQARARAARYDLLSHWAQSQGLDYVLLGHTEDDVAETFLMRLARGSGLDGLAAMQQNFLRDGVVFARPLLDLDRDALRGYLERHGYDWRDDPSNTDRKFQRTRARDALKALKPLGIDAKTLVYTAVNLSGPKMALIWLVREHADDFVSMDRGDLLYTAEDKLPNSGELSRRLMSAMLKWQGMTPYPPRSDALIDLEIAMYRGKAHTLNGCLVTRKSTQIRVAREYNAVKNFTCETTDLWDGRWSLIGPHAADLRIGALGQAGLAECPDWRDTGLPRTSLLASPAVWRGTELVAAPVAGMANGWCATLTRSREQFLSALLSH